MKKERVIDIIRSWKNTEGNVHTTQELMEWIKELNATTHVSVERASVYDSDFSIKRCQRQGCNLFGINCYRKHGSSFVRDKVRRCSGSIVPGGNGG